MVFRNPNVIFISNWLESLWNMTLGPNFCQSTMLALHPGRLVRFFVENPGSATNNFSGSSGSSDSPQKDCYQMSCVNFMFLDQLLERYIAWSSLSLSVNKPSTTTTPRQRWRSCKIANVFVKITSGLSIQTDAKQSKSEFCSFFVSEYYFPTNGRIYLYLGKLLFVKRFGIILSKSIFV